MMRRASEQGNRNIFNIMGAVKRVGTGAPEGNHAFAFRAPLGRTPT
jgi:hypothetical protein